MSGKDPLAPDGGNPILACLAASLRAKAESENDSDPHVLIAPGLLLAIGSFIVGAVSAVDSAAQQRAMNDKLNAIRDGLDAVQQQIASISGKLDRVLAELANLLPEIQEIVKEALYRNTLQNRLSEASTAQQNIATFNTSPTVAWQRIDQINSALYTLQVSSRVIFDAGPMKLDTALLVAPLVATWITEWDMNEAVWKENDSAHVPIKARDHLFLKDTVIPQFKSLFDRCEQAFDKATSDLASLACPGDPDSLSAVFEYNAVSRKFRSVSSYPLSPRLFRYDSFQIAVPLQISQKSSSGVVSWQPAVKLASDGSAIRNPKLDDPDIAFEAWETRKAIWEHRRNCKATIEALTDRVKERKRVMSALNKL